MNLKFFFVIAVLGLLTVTEGNFPKLRLDPHGRLDPKAAKRFTSIVDDTIDQNWKKHTKVAAEDDTVFYSDKFKSNIRGKIMHTLWEERTIYAYQGFKFATSERFKPPVDIRGKYWTGRNFNATHIGLKCAQGSLGGGDEDCLYLNVYTPYKPGSENATGLPVMVFIHGGAFVLGSSATYMPTKLLNYDVILVTIHYRLGIFGFYTRDSPNAPGNLALYDMISSLRWVQRNIEEFGGDKGLVTVFGESAGSVSANYMMLLTGKQNLFRGVIAESGSALDHWAYDEDYLFASNYIEEAVNCNVTSGEEDEILECMGKVPTQELIDALQSLISSDRKHGLIGFRGCSPTLQTFDDTGLTFKKILYQEPREFFFKKEFKKVPFMTGSNREEGSLITAITLFDYLIPNGLWNNTDYLRSSMIRDLLLSVGVKDEPESLATSLQNMYCDGVDLGDLQNAQYCLIDICGILFLKAGSWQASNYHSYFSNHSTYYYSFEFESDDSIGAVHGPNNLTFYAGVSHGDEIKYIFSGFARMDDFPGQEAVAKRMTLLWTNFARYLNPTPAEDTDWKELDIPEWTPYKFEDPHYMLINTDFRVGKDFRDRWTVTNDLFQNGLLNLEKGKLSESENSPTTVDPDECVGKCAEYDDQKDAYMISMIVFIVAFVIACLGATYFFFKARK